MVGNSYLNDTLQEVNSIHHTDSEKEKVNLIPESGNVISVNEAGSRCKILTLPTIAALVRNGNKIFILKQA